MLWTRREPAGPHELVVDREVGSLLTAPHCPCHVLPSPFSQKSMVSTRYQGCAIFKGGAERGLDDAPMGEHTSLHIAAVPADAFRPKDRVADLELFESLGRTVGQENWRISLCAVDASVFASAIWIDRLRETDVGRLIAADDRTSG